MQSRTLVGARPRSRSLLLVCLCLLSSQNRPISNWLVAGTWFKPPRLSSLSVNKQICRRSYQRSSSAPISARWTGKDIALLIDGDVIKTADLGVLLKELGRYGYITIRRIYANAKRLNNKPFLIRLRELDIEPILVPVNGAGNKDTTDMCIAWDAALLSTDPSAITGRKDQQVGIVAVAALDFDYLEIFRQMKKLPAPPRGYFVQPDISLMTSDSKLDQLRSLGVEWIKYRQEETREFNVQVVIDGCNPRIVFERISTTVSPLDGSELKAGDTLSKLGYLSSELATSGILEIKAAAKFFYVNSLGPLVLYPERFRVQQTLIALEAEPESGWIPDPGNLVYIHPIASSSRKKIFGTTQGTQYADGGGPFLMHQSDDLVRRVLVKLGYLSQQHMNTQEAYVEAMSSFWERNKKYMLRAGVQSEETEANKLTEREEVLFSAFTQQLGRQQWRTARKP